jgi:hypothetical protein
MPACLRKSRRVYRLFITSSFAPHKIGNVPGHHFVFHSIRGFEQERFSFPAVEALSKKLQGALASRQ